MGHEEKGQGTDRKRKHQRVNGEREATVGLFLPAKGIVNGHQGIRSQIGQTAADRVRAELPEKLLLAKRRPGRKVS